MYPSLFQEFSIHFLKRCGEITQIKMYNPKFWFERFLHVFKKKTKIKNVKFFYFLHACKNFTLLGFLFFSL